MKKFVKSAIDYARRDFWDFLSWVAFAVGVIYVFLKVRGILHSPIISDMIGIGSVAYFLGMKSQKLDRLERDLQKLDLKTERMNENSQELKYDFKAHILTKKAH